MAKKKQDGRGRSAGSRKTQFSKDNQPDRSRRRQKRDRPDNAVDPIRAAIFQKVGVNKNGKSEKVPAIDALMHSILKNAFAADLGDQIKLFREITKSGVFDVEEYKERIFRNMNAHFKRALDAGDRAYEFLEELGEDYKRVSHLYFLYLLAYLKSAAECTCGACERGFNFAETVLPSLLQDLADSFDDEDDEDESQEGLEDDEDLVEDRHGSRHREGEGSEEPEASDKSSLNKKAPEKAKKPKSDPPIDPDDEFYSGMFGGGRNPDA